MKKNLLVLVFLAHTVSHAQCWQKIAGGGATAHGIKSDGTLWAWGLNDSGEVGDGTIVNKNAPVEIGSASWQSVSLLGFHSLALQTNGSLYAFGSNLYGQLGDGTNTNKNVPTPILPGTAWKMASAGVYHSLAIKSDGTLWAWGRNSSGELGDGTVTGKNAPLQIGTDANWELVSAGWKYSLAKKTDGTLWAWGSNDTGQLGDGTLTDSTVPLQVGADVNWKQIVAGWGFTVALKANGTAWIWGGYSGEFSATHTPMQIDNQTDWAFITGGDDHYAAIKTNGTLWAAGENQFGGLGNGTTTNEDNLVQIGTRTDWKNVYAAGYLYTVALTTDGELWSWGNNNNGQLGDGTGNNSLVPIPISCPATLASAAFGKANISVYPNPASSRLFIKNTGLQPADHILITDTAGKKIIDRQSASEIDVQNLPKGLYFISIYSGKEVFKSKFLKE